MLRLSGIGKTYGGRTVLRDISLHAAPGTLTLVTGPNGAGKSTLLHIMAGLLRPDSGTLERTVPAGKTGFLGHDTCLYPNLTALENLAFWTSLHGTGADDSALMELLDRMGLLPFADEPASGFSRGMAQRLSLARMLALSPSLVLLDEPMTGLDADSAALVRTELLSLRNTGAGLVWVSHDPARDGGGATAFLHLGKTSPGTPSKTQPPKPSGDIPAKAPSKTQHPKPSGDIPAKTPSMTQAAFVLAAKDIRILAGRGNVPLQSVLLGLLLIVLFSLALDGTGKTGATEAAAIFWLASAFCLTILAISLFMLEEADAARKGLLLSPHPAQYVWLGKTLALLGLLLLVQAVLLVASFVFLGISLTENVLFAIGGIILADTGAAGLAALLASLCRGQGAKESLASIIVFPLLIPLLLSGIRLLAAGYGEGAATADLPHWIGLAAAFDAIFTAAALALFPVIYGGEN